MHRLADNWVSQQWYTCTENTNIRGSINVRLTSCLFCLDSAALLKLNEQQIYLFRQIQTSQTGGHLYSDTSPYGECSLTCILSQSARVSWSTKINTSLLLLMVCDGNLHVGRNSPGVTLIPLGWSGISRRLQLLWYYQNQLLLHD